MGKKNEEYSGRFVATLHGKFIASARTFQALIQALEKQSLNNDQVIIEYVDPTGIPVVYFDPL